MDREELLAVARAIIAESLSGSAESRAIAEEHANAMLSREARAELLKSWPIGREPKLAA